LLGCLTGLRSTVGCGSPCCCWFGSYRVLPWFWFAVLAGSGLLFSGSLLFCFRCTFCLCCWLILDSCSLRYNDSRFCCLVAIDLLCVVLFTLPGWVVDCCCWFVVLRCSRVRFVTFVLLLRSLRYSFLLFPIVSSSWFCSGSCSLLICWFWWGLVLVPRFTLVPSCWFVTLVPFLPFILPWVAMGGIC
jgi:hypothetical protein